MKLPKYQVTASADYHTYFFFSEGPRGKIAKAVMYSPISETLYNLGFGDYNEELQEIDDFSRSNNGDSDKILATVAFTVLDFTSVFPRARIYIEGSTPARTRLYQIGIAGNLLEINEIFQVYGLFNDNWELFRKDKPYNSFLITKI